MGATMCLTQNVYVDRFLSLRYGLRFKEVSREINKFETLRRNGFLRIFASQIRWQFEFKNTTKKEQRYKLFGTLFNCTLSTYVKCALFLLLCDCYCDFFLLPWGMIGTPRNFYFYSSFLYSFIWLLYTTDFFFGSFCTTLSIWRVEVCIKSVLTLLLYLGLH